MIRRWRRTLPRRGRCCRWPRPGRSTYALGSEHLDLYVAAPSLAAAHPATADFFPATSGIIKNAAPQLVGYAKDGMVLRLAPGAKASGTLEGLLVLTGTDGSTQALEVSVPPGPVPSVEFAAAAADSGDLSLWAALAFAFLGGLILNVMPCVLPILAMKALAVADHGARGQGESFAYAAGAVLSFAVLGLSVLLLRAGGDSVGWGFQLQSPIAVAGFALLVFAVGLNLSGLFEVGSITAGEGLASRGGWVGAFFTGVLAVAVAAPCTAPFMAAALGFALTLSAPLALLVFIALGVGFALPFLLLGLWPRALAFIPKPGPWMLTFKQFLAFPMYGCGGLAGLGAGAGSRPARRGHHSVRLHRAGPGALAVGRDARHAARPHHRRSWLRCSFFWPGFMASACCATQRPRLRRRPRSLANPSRPPSLRLCARRTAPSLSTPPPPGASPVW